MSEIIMYTTEDGVTKIDVRYENENVWLSLNDLAELFQKDKSTISRHIKNIFDDGELQQNSVVANFATTATDGKTYQVSYYNLDVAISVGYRVKSPRGVQFRIWANSIIKEYMLKGFAMNDDLLKQSGGGGYFNELLSRIRDIRSSEKVFYRQVLDLFATSIDYSPESSEAKEMFATIQNKMHWATHGHTASELIALRADSEKPFMGLTTFKGDRPAMSDVTIAKNYLSEKELSILNRLVSAYLDLAEIHALKEEKMYMKDWLVEIDDFLKMTKNEILQNAGKVSRLEAEYKAKLEYGKYKDKSINELTAVEKDFLQAIKKTEKLLKEKQ